MFDGTSQSNDVSTRGLQRAVGRARVVVGLRDDTSVLRDLYQQGSMKVRFPRVFGTGGAEAVLINTSGGLTGGDVMNVDIVAEAGSRFTVTTQACERVYKSSGGTARVASDVAIQSGAELNWLPQETIFFEGGALARSLNVDMATDSRFLAVEAMMLGRTAMGERITTGDFRDRWRVRRDGKLVFADEARLTGDIAKVIADPATLGGRTCFATVLMVAPDVAARLESARAALDNAADDVLAGATTFDGMLIARLTGHRQQSLRAAMVELITVLRDGAGIPRVWNI